MEGDTDTEKKMTPAQLSFSFTAGAVLWLAMFAACADAAGVVEGFETMEAGKPVAAPWKYRCPPGYDSVRITTDKAASGEKSLAISADVPRKDRHKTFLPSVRRPVSDSGVTGTAIFEGDVLFAPGTDTRIVICLRSGPKMRASASLLNCLGRLTSAGTLVWNGVEADRWYHFKFVIHKSLGSADLEVSEKGAEWRNVFNGIPLGKPEEVFPLKEISIYFGGPAKKGACAYFDDIKFESKPR